MNLSRWANIATIAAFILYVILTLVDKWQEVAKLLGGSSVIFMASLVVLILGIIFAGITFYASRSKPQSNRVRVISNPQGYQYLVQGNNCCHIPDPPTFDYLGSYFGFCWADSELMLPDEINRRFTIGKQLPSILLYCPKVEQK